MKVQFELEISDEQMQALKDDLICVTNNGITVNGVDITNIYDNMYSQLYCGPKKIFKVYWKSPNSKPVEIEGFSIEDAFFNDGRFGPKAIDAVDHFETLK